MNFRIVFLGLIFYVGYCSASELMVYRWVDKNNVVHFSQHQPLDDEYTEFLVSNQSKITSRADALDSSSAKEQKSLSKQNTANFPSTIDTSKKCKEAQENIAMLKAFDKVQYTDENGNNQILNKKEKQQQLEINLKRTEIYCSSSN